MNIAFLTSEYPHPQTGFSGGIGTSIKNLAISLLELNNKVHVFVIAQDIDSSFEDRGVIIHQLKNIKCRGLSWWLTSKKIERKFAELHLKEKFDLLEVQDYLGILSFVSCNVKTVVKLHGSDSFFCYLDKRKVKWWNKFNEKRTFKKADAIIAVSQFAGDVSNIVFSSNRSFQVIGNGVDIRRFTTSQPNNKNRILYFGTLIRKKGVFELASIFNEVNEKDPDTLLILVGKDSSDKYTGLPSTWDLMHSMLSEKARENVRFKGEISYEEIMREIGESTICVFPSLSETFGMVTIEAMACSKTVITSNRGWANEIIEPNKEGFLIDPQNHKDYCSVILEVLRNTNLQKEIGKNARAKVESCFANEVIAAKCIDFYQSVILEK